VTDTCNINWHLASSEKESFTVFIALPLFPTIECDVNNANDTASYFTYKSKKKNYEVRGCLICHQTPHIYKLLDTILELALWNDHVHYEGFNRIPFL